jgi:hypothetical protein
MKKEELEKVAKTIIEIEERLRLGKSVQEGEAEIENLIHNLSFEDLLIIDDYIQKYLT